MADLSNFRWVRNRQQCCYIALTDGDFHYYQITESDERRNQDYLLSPEQATIKELYTYLDNGKHKLKTFAVHPTSQYEVVTASQEKLYSLDLCGTGDTLINIPFSQPRQSPRRIHLLEWSIISPSKLAIATEKSRTTKGIHVLDLHSHSKVQNFGNDGESIQSIAWSPHSSDILVAGTSKKRIEIFDIRAKAKESRRSTADIQETDGVCFSPSYEHILASHSDEYVKLWDSRNMKSFLHSMKCATSDVCKIEWCPTHPTRIGYLTKSAKQIQILEFPIYKMDKTEKETAEATGMLDQEQHKQKSAPDMTNATIANFTWHPYEPNKILCCKASLEDTSKMYVLTLHEAIIPVFTPTDSLIWGCSDKLLQCDTQIEDIADTMVKRIKAGYGFDPKKNRAIVDGEPDLEAFWAFFVGVTAQKPAPEVEAPRSRSMQVKISNIPEVTDTLDVKMGICGLISGGEYDSSCMCDQREPPFSLFYTSPRRTKCIEMCRWPGQQTHNLDREVALRLWQRGLEEAITLLKRNIEECPGDDSKRILLIALSGHDSSHAETESVWRRNLRLLCGELTNPYRRAMFNFLKSEANVESSYEEILEDTQLLLEDRILFACRFLPDLKLAHFLQKLMKAEIAAGNIRAILLTGIQTKLLALLQEYLDTTSDVQTVCLALTLARKYTEQPGRVRLAELAENSYLRFFDMRRMWIERALYQNQAKKLLLNKASVPNHLCSIKCYKCDQSIANQRSLPRNNGQQLSRPFDKRFCSSTNCKKPLPRCALCMYHLGTTSRFDQISNGRKDRYTEQRQQNSAPSTFIRGNPVAEWFVWCLACSHGGHSNHMAAWFTEHKICPTPGCRCKCREIDIVPTLDSLAINDVAVS